MGLFFAVVFQDNPKSQSAYLGDCVFFTCTAIADTLNFMVNATHYGCSFHPVKAPTNCLLEMSNQSLSATLSICLNESDWGDAEQADIYCLVPMVVSANDTKTRPCNVNSVVAHLNITKPSGKRMSWHTRCGVFCSEYSSFQFYTTCR